MKTTASKIPDGWQKMSLGEIGTTLSGLTGKTKEDFGHGKPFIPYMNVFKNSHIDKDFLNFVELDEGERQNRLQYGDYIFTTSSETPEEVGMSTVVNTEIGEIYLNSFCFIFRPEKKVLDPNFGGYLFRGPDFRKEIGTHAKGSTRFNLSKRDFLGVNILFPESKQEQKKIADILSAVDNEIRITDEIIRHTETLKRALMRKLFTAAKGKIHKLKEIVSISSGGTPPKKDDELWQGEIPWVSPKDMKGIDIKDAQDHISDRGRSYAGNASPGDTLIVVRSGILAHHVPIALVGRELSFNQDIKRIAVTDRKEVDPEYIFNFLLSKERDLLQRGVKRGTTVHSINTGFLEEMQILVPDMDEQKQVVKVLTSLHKKISINKSIRRAQVLLRKGLMSDLLKGTKRV